MQVGLIGAGNMARALARGWGEPVLCSDGGSGRARDLARELGGEAFDSNVEVAERADLVVLCHKPAQFKAVRDELHGHVKAIASILAGVGTSALRAYEVPVFRFMPNTAVEVKRGVVCYSPEHDVDEQLEAQVLELFGRLGAVVEVPEALMDAAGATSPGGTTARGLAALERAGVRPAFQDAFDAVVAATR